MFLRFRSGSVQRAGNESVAQQLETAGLDYYARVLMAGDVIIVIIVLRSIRLGYQMLLVLLLMVVVMLMLVLQMHVLLVHALVAAAAELRQIASANIAAIRSDHRARRVRHKTRVHVIVLLLSKAVAERVAVGAGKHLILLL